MNEVLDPIVPVFVRHLAPAELEGLFASSPHNTRAFASVLDPNQTDIKLMQNHNAEDVYVIAGDGVAYASYEERQARSLGSTISGLAFRGTKLPRMSLHPNQARGLEPNYVLCIEEARARMLHRALGVAGLRLAAHAETAAEFQERVNWVTRVFNLQYSPTAGGLSQFDTAESAKTLFYLFKRSAIKHKTIPTQQGENLIRGIAKSFTQGHEWYHKYGYNLAVQIGYDDSKRNEEHLSPAYTKPTHTRRELDRAIQEFLPDYANAIIYDPQLGDVTYTHFNHYANFLGVEGKFTSPEAKLKFMYRKYVSEKLPFPYIDTQTRNVSIYHGILAYLRTNARQFAARQLFETLEPRNTGNLTPIVVASNIIIEKMRHNKDLPDRLKIDLPGYNVENMDVCFNAIRQILNDARGVREEGVSEQLGQILEKHIAQTFNGSISTP